MGFMEIYQLYINIIDIYLSTQSSTCPNSWHQPLNTCLLFWQLPPLFAFHQVFCTSATSIQDLGPSEESPCLHKQDAALIDFPTFHFIFNNLWRGAWGILQEALGLFIPLDKLIPNDPASNKLQEHSHYSGHWHITLFLSQQSCKAALELLWLWRWASWFHMGMLQADLVATTCSDEVTGATTSMHSIYFSKWSQAAVRKDFYAELLCLTVLLAEWTFHLHWQCLTGCSYPGSEA